LCGKTFCGKNGEFNIEHDLLCACNMPQHVVTNNVSIGSFCGWHQPWSFVDGRETANGKELLIYHYNPRRDVRTGMLATRFHIEIPLQEKGLYICTYSKHTTQSLQASQSHTRTRHQLITTRRFQDMQLIRTRLHEVSFFLGGGRQAGG